MSRKVYSRTGIDAGVVVEKRGSIVMFDFLAKGRSQKKKAGKVIGYTLRNPERRALVEAILAALGGNHCTVEATRVGKECAEEAPPPSLGLPWAKPERIDNLRFQMWISVPRTALDTVLITCNLEEATERRLPAAVAWPGEVSK